jgi:hypothetical protein
MLGYSYRNFNALMTSIRRECGTLSKKEATITFYAAAITMALPVRRATFTW